MKPIHLVAVIATVVALGACTDERIVYDRRTFNPPPDTIAGFLGYFDIDKQQTSCGNCHVVHQRDWKTTAHASAWAGLETAGSPPPALCTGCHSVSGRGNPVVGNAGYNLVADSAYHDVQCESCHGPGFTHAETPDFGPAPLASIAVHIPDSLGTCGECHSGTHTPFAEEWEQSRHAEANPATFANASCVGCHEGRGILKRWGVTANYVEKDDVVDATTAIGITCSVCHNPHGSPYSKQLRFPIETDDPAENLCMQCHMRRTVPASGSSRGNQPHAPQGAVLLAEAGYINTAYVDTLLLGRASHGVLSINPRLCAGCHLFAFPTTDTAGTFNQATGHLFRPIPCYGPDGLPTNTIQNCAYTPVERSFRPCAGSGCHATQDQAAFALNALRTNRLQPLSRQLWVDVNGDRVIDSYPADTGYLPRIKANTGDLNATAAPVTAADGAEFNLRLVGEDGLGFLYDNGDKSHGAHNPFYAETLLRASIDELFDLYGAQPWFTPPSPEVQQILNGPLGVSGSKPFPRPAGKRTASR